MCGMGTISNRLWPQGKDFQEIRRLGPDGSRPAGLVYEHAETGGPLRSNDRNRSPEYAARLAACTRQGPGKPSKSIGTSERCSTLMGLRSVRLRPNGVFSSQGRPKHSATQYPQPAVRSVFLPRLAAREAGSCAQAALQWLSAHPISCRLRASPSNLAACTGCS